MSSVHVPCLCTFFEEAKAANITDAVDAFTKALPVVTVATMLFVGILGVYVVDVVSDFYLFVCMADESLVPLGVVNVGPTIEHVSFKFTGNGAHSSGCRSGVGGRIGSGVGSRVSGGSRSGIGGGVLGHLALVPSERRTAASHTVVALFATALVDVSSVGVVDASGRSILVVGGTLADDARVVVHML